MLPQIFDGEEFSRAIRLWTHGYDFYTPNTNLIYHDYLKKMGPQDEVEKSVWGSHPPPEAQRRKAEELAGSVKRLKVLLRMPSDTLNQLRGGSTEEQPGLAVGELYGLGTKRTYEQYVQFSGLDPSQHIAASGGRCNLDNFQDWVPYSYSESEHSPSNIIVVDDASAMTTQKVRSACELLFIGSLLVLLVAVVIYKRKTWEKSAALQRASQYLPLHKSQGPVVEEIDGRWV